MKQLHYDKIPSTVLIKFMNTVCLNVWLVVVYSVTFDMGKFCKENTVNILFYFLTLM